MFLDQLPQAGPSDPEDYELVLGKRQIASLSFLAVILIGVFSTISYIAGRSIERHSATRAVASARPSQTPEPPRTIPIDAIVVPSQLNGSQVSAAPKKLYLQIAATDRLHAIALAATVRGKGYPALVAEGPVATTFRVLVGPYTDTVSITQARNALQAEGYVSFIRRAGVNIRDSG